MKTGKRGGLTKPQWNLLLLLYYSSHPPLYLHKNNLVPCKTLADRGLATRERDFASITPAGRELVAAVRAKEKTQ